MQDKLTTESQAVSPDTEAGQEAVSVDTMPSLETLLKETQLKAEEHHDAWLRAKAETENVRRRAAEDVIKASKFAIEKFAGELIAVKDSLEAALATETPSADTLKAGTELTLKQLTAAFEKVHIQEVAPQGQKFDPNFHQAMGMLESDEPANTVISVLQKGYLLADRVLRPALVMVAKPKA